MIAHYWPLIAVAILGFILVAWLVGWYGAGNVKGRPNVERERRSSRRWARLSDVPKLRIDGASGDLTDRALLGQLEGRRLAMPPLYSLMVVAPSGMGKTARYVVPQLLSWSGAAVVTSVKGDALVLTVDHRRTQGPVWIFDPTGASGHRSCRWEPLSGADTYAGALKVATWLTDSSKVAKMSSNEEQLWDTLGQELVAPLLFAARRGGYGMEQVSIWVRYNQEQDVAVLLEQLGDRDAQAAWAATCSTNDRTKNSIYATARRILSCYTHPAVREALTHRAGEQLLDVDELLDAGGTLYIVAPESDQELFTPVFETLVNSVVRAVEERHVRTGRPISPHLMLMLEEAANCAPLRKLAKIASAGRGQGLELISIWQDEAQLETIYSAAEARTIKANHAAKLALPGISDESTLEWISGLVGDDHFHRTTRSVGTDRGVSTSSSYVRERVAPSDFIRELPDDECIGIALNWNPLLLKTRAWFEDENLRAKVNPEIARAFDEDFGGPSSRRGAGRTTKGKVRR